MELFKHSSHFQTQKRQKKKKRGNRKNKGEKKNKGRKKKRPPLSETNTTFNNTTVTAISIFSHQYLAMTSSVIHYRFKNTKAFDKVHFDGAVFSVLDLKRSIIQQKNLGKGALDFDLWITNAQTGEGAYITRFVKLGFGFWTRNRPCRETELKPRTCEMTSVLRATFC